MSAEPPEPFDALPRSLVDLAETLGLPVALRLIAHFGGTEVRIPKRPAPDHPILKALGEEDGAAVCRFLGGQQIYVPRGGQGGRWRQAQEMAGRGMTRAQIARVLGVSQRHIRRLANGGPRKIDQDARQTRLFDD